MTGDVQRPSQGLGKVGVHLHRLLMRGETCMVLGQHAALPIEDVCPWPMATGSSQGTQFYQKDGNHQRLFLFPY